MQAKEKRRYELDRQMEERKTGIKKAAISEFIENGISNTTISDIAKRAEVGEATVYRYFETKPNLVIECAVYLWNREAGKFLPKLALENQKDLSGYEKVKKVFALFGGLFETYPSLLILLEQFDTYIIKEELPAEELVNFEGGILSIYSMVTEMLKAGQQDGSIRPEIDAGHFYITAAHTIVALSQKLLLRGNIIQSDVNFSARKQIDTLIDMQLHYLRADKV